MKAHAETWLMQRLNTAYFAKKCEIASTEGKNGKKIN